MMNPDVTIWTFKPKDAPIGSVTLIDDRRQAIRMTTSGQAVLRTGGRQIKVELSDQSRGGFMVLMDKAPKFQVDAVGKLQTERGWSNVRVAYIEKKEGRFRVGLELLADLCDQRDFERQLQGGRHWQHSRSDNDWVYRLGVLTLVAVLAGVALTYLLMPELPVWRQIARYSANLWQSCQELLGR